MKLYEETDLDYMNILRPMLAVKGCDVDNAVLTKVFKLVDVDDKEQPWEQEVPAEIANWVDLCFSWDD